MSLLHPVKHDLKSTLWCGPAALSAISGRPTSEIHGILKQVRNSDRPIKGIYNRELKAAAERLGYRLEPVFQWCAGAPASWKRPTLAKFVRENRQELGLPVVVQVTGHYVVVHKQTFMDNFCPEGVRLKRAPHRRCRVKNAWRAVPIVA